MSNATVQLRGKKNLADEQVRQSGSASPAWWLVFIRELSDLWIGGKALVLVFIYTVFLGVIGLSRKASR